MLLHLKCVAAMWIVATALIQEPTSKSRDSADTTEISRLETVWNDAYVRGDADALERLCSDDLIVTMTNMQVLNKTTSIGILRSGRVRFQRYETSDLRIRVYDNAAVVTGRLQRTRNAQGKQMDDNWRFTKLYVRSAGRWQVVAWHASTVEQ